MVAKRQYVDEFDYRYRLRVTTETYRGKLLSWAAQLEWLSPEEGWVWIARVDTAGGQPHEDRNRIAAHQVVELPSEPGQALRAAIDLLKARGEEYTEAYKAAKTLGKEAW
jgi:hypothetical protein